MALGCIAGIIQVTGILPPEIACVMCDAGNAAERNIYEQIFLQKLLLFSLRPAWPACLRKWIRKAPPVPPYVIDQKILWSV